MKKFLLLLLTFIIYAANCDTQTCIVQETATIHDVVLSGCNDVSVCDIHKTLHDTTNCFMYSTSEYLIVSPSTVVSWKKVPFTTLHQTENLQGINCPFMLGGTESHVISKSNVKAIMEIYISYKIGYSTDAYNEETMQAPAISMELRKNELNVMERLENIYPWRIPGAQTPSQRAEGIYEGNIYLTTALQSSMNDKFDLMISVSKGITPEEVAIGTVNMLVQKFTWKITTYV